MSIGSIPTSLPINNIAQSQALSRQLQGTPGEHRNAGGPSQGSPSTFDSLLSSLSGSNKSR